MKKKALQELEGIMEKEAYERFIEPLEYDEIGICIDPVCFVVFALIWNGRCRKALEELLPDEAVYYEYYGKSKYCSPVFESHFRAEDIWMARRLTGMLEKLRAQGKPGKEGELLMRAVYAGYRHLKRAVRNLHSLNGAVIKEMLCGNMEEYNGMEHAVRMILAVLIAEDLDVPFEWDYDWLAMALFLEEYEDEFASRGDEETDECGSSAQPGTGTGILSAFPIEDTPTYPLTKYTGLY